MDTEAMKYDQPTQEAAVRLAIAQARVADAEAALQVLGREVDDPEAEAEFAPESGGVAVICALRVREARAELVEARRLWDEKVAGWASAPYAAP